MTKHPVLALFLAVQFRRDLLLGPVGACAACNRRADVGNSADPAVPWQLLGWLVDSVPFLAAWAFVNSNRAAFSCSRARNQHNPLALRDKGRPRDSSALVHSRR